MTVVNEIGKLQDDLDTHVKVEVVGEAPVANEEGKDPVLKVKKTPLEKFVKRIMALNPRYKRGDEYVPMKPAVLKYLLEKVEDRSYRDRQQSVSPVLFVYDNAPVLKGVGIEHFIEELKFIACEVQVVIIDRVDDQPVKIPESLRETLIAISMNNPQIDLFFNVLSRPVLGGSGRRSSVLPRGLRGEEEHDYPVRGGRRDRY